MCIYTHIYAYTHLCKTRIPDTIWYLGPSCVSLTNYVSLRYVEDGQPRLNISLLYPSCSFSIQLWLNGPRTLDCCSYFPLASFVFVLWLVTGIRCFLYRKSVRCGNLAVFSKEWNRTVSCTDIKTPKTRNSRFNFWRYLLTDFHESWHWPFG